MKISMLTRTALAAAASLLLTGCPGEVEVTQLYNVPANSQIEITLACPLGYDLEDWDYTIETLFGPAPYDRSFAVLTGDGGALSVIDFVGQNLSSSILQVRVTAWCYPHQSITAVSGSASFTYVPVTQLIQPGHVGTLQSYCPNAYSAINGGFNAGSTGLLPVGSYPLFNGPPGQQSLGDQPDGTSQIPLIGWQVDIFNYGSMPQTAAAWVLCEYGQPVEVQVRSGILAPGASGVFWTPFPDGSFPLGRGFTGGVSGLFQGTALWQDNAYSFNRPLGFGSADGYPRAAIYFGQNTSNSPNVVAKAATTVKTAAIYIPNYQAAPPVAQVPVIEYYAPALDHYFITAIPQEIAALDNHTIPGWQRTGQSFNAYGIGSGGPMDRRPVCRFYGSPAAGLDSHFYTASALECRTTRLRFAGVWQLEADEVFEMNLPDPNSGACPAGNVSVFRLWNNRVDSNHRYTTSTVIRDQMLARGYLPEGYGPQNVALCAPA